MTHREGGLIWLPGKRESKQESGWPSLPDFLYSCLIPSLQRDSENLSISLTLSFRACYDPFFPSLPFFLHIPCLSYTSHLYYTQASSHIISLTHLDNPL